MYKLLKKLVEQKGRAPTPSFSIHHISKAIEILADAKVPLSRKKLGNFLSLGEGSIRTLLGRLEVNKVVKIQPRGIVLASR